MAIKVTKGQIWDGPISKNLKYHAMCLSTKFHTLSSKVQFYHSLHKSAVLIYAISE